MKPMKFFAVISIVALFVFENANAQPGKEKISYTVQDLCIRYPCTDEVMCGDIFCTEVYWNSKVQLKGKGTLIGQTSGDEYTVSQIVNSNWKPWAEEVTQGKVWVTQFTIEKNGELIGILHLNQHFTLHPDGTVTGDPYNYFVECY